MLHSLAHRGISREAYLQISGREEDEILAEMQPDAEQALRREAVITAVVAAEEIGPTEERLLEALAPTAEREGVEPQKLLEDLRAAGRLEDVREDLAAREAIDLIASEAQADPARAGRRRARSCGRPSKDGARPRAPAPRHGAGELWTPAGCGRRTS